MGNTPLLTPPPKKKKKLAKKSKNFCFAHVYKTCVSTPLPPPSISKPSSSASGMTGKNLSSPTLYYITVKLIIFQNLSLKTARECLRDHPVGEKCIDRRDF